MPEDYDCKMDNQELSARISERREAPVDIDPKEEMADLGVNYDDANDADNEGRGGDIFSDWEDEEDDDSDLEHGSDPMFKRDIAEGQNLNNSYVGPYPPEWDHLHFDKGPN